MVSDRLPVLSPEERGIYSLIAASDGIMAKEIAAKLGLGRTAVNRLLFSSPLMHELCFQDDAFRWHALVRQGNVHEGLFEVSGW